MYDCFLEYLRIISLLDGDIIEVGVHKGSSLNILGALTKSLNINKTIYGVDTFCGMPDIVIDGLDNGHDIKGESTPGKGGHFPGDFKDTSILQVAKTAPWPNIKLIPGIFPDCADQIKSNKFCFAHIDVDIYNSYKNSYQYLWPRIVPGGVMVCGDDYLCPWLPGAKKAIDEVVVEFGVIPVISPRGQHIIIKP
jgi:O-methyltransferase